MQQYNVTEQQETKQFYHWFDTDGWATAITMVFFLLVHPAESNSHKENKFF